ncbi:hypothetical protein SmJEL517_g04168 [Synchytrium microbalum]|uniref:VWFA domain-containing protein n=1 Tax=Synchytrium microbalum TaxID=1806994 RepID=A0A507C3Y5_9FUNG|nr:uncharacterized protein SmJEL517_g04168 [Synchytrium microbalum]TPX32824.1 hypothetical protein SmJEL517_g04168 [Synchytrium microbalum]
MEEGEEFEQYESKKSKRLDTVGNETTMNMNTLLHANILSSTYFKNLYDYKTWSEVMAELKNEEPFLKGTVPSTAFCILYKLWTLKLTVRQLERMVTDPKSPHARAIGFLYLRYVCKPDQLWDWFEPYLDDEEEVQSEAGPRPRSITIGKMVNDLLTQQKWIGTVLPRIPVPIARDIEKKLKERPPPKAAEGDEDDYIMEDPLFPSRNATAAVASPRASDGHRSPPGARSPRDDRRNDYDRRDHYDRDRPSGSRDRRDRAPDIPRDDRRYNDRRYDDRRDRYDESRDRRDRYDDSRDRRDRYDDSRDRGRYDDRSRDRRRSSSPRGGDRRRERDHEQKREEEARRREEEDLRKKRAEEESKRKAQERLNALKKKRVVKSANKVDVLMSEFYRACFWYFSAKIGKVTHKIPKMQMDVDEEEERQPEGDDSTKQYVWEGAYEMSWQQIQEDDEGTLRSAVANILNRKRKRPQRDTAAVRRGIIRNLYIILDLSRCMLEGDLKPTRIEASISLAKTFIQDFFDQNPLSSLGLIGTRDGNAEKITELSGNPSEHIAALDDDKAKKDGEEDKEKLSLRDVRGEASIQNSLELARVSLGHVPTHGSREILVLLGSLSTVDPGSVFDTVDALVTDKIRVSIIGLSAEVQICKEICKRTGGAYNVVMDDQNYKELVLKNVPPPVLTTENSPANMVEMGFPKSFLAPQAVLCSCHPRPIRRGFKCPRCDAIVCDLPTDCPICSLPLVSSPLLARSYHHLFPVPEFRELDHDQIDWKSNQERCFSCVQAFEEPLGLATPKAMLLPTSSSNGPALPLPSGVYECPKCTEKFCSDCESFVHETLHLCPGCSNSRKPRQKPS